MNEHVHANVIGWSHMRCQVHLCVRVYIEGGSSIYERLRLVFFPFFLSRRQHCSTEQGGRGGERERERERERE